MALPPDQVTLLIRRARDERDPNAREAMVSAYAPLVKSVAARFLGSGETFEDLLQEGNLGLLSAIDLFNPDHKIQFSTYAHHLIAGPIRHYLRDRGTRIRQPAWIQEERARVEKARTTLTEELSREPTAQELAEKANLEEGRLQEILATQRMSHVLRLDIGMPEETPDAVDEERIQEAAPEPALAMEDRLALQDAMMKLKLVERRVVEDFYFGDLSQTEIARRLGVSCNYVSRILKSSTQRLQEHLSDRQAPAKTSRRLEQKLRAPVEEGVTDEPTGLYTPSYFLDRLDEELIRARRYGHSLSVIRVLVDGIPEVGKADVLAKALRVAGQAVRNNVRRIDITARIDKREFGVILPYTGANASVAGERVTHALENNEEGLPFQARCGLAVYPDESVTVDGLMNLAKP
ncbi:MAG: sigma-70 family RNA polymerase sigma factor [Armatimonadetes bacterium]|nr:sigma-70 family RNA polymerase sigma factor [Armatimonadota bacterium]